MSYDTLCLESRRPLIDIRHDCYYCEELDRIYRGWVCFPPVRNGEVSAECYIPAIHPHPHPNTFCQVDGEEGVGRVEPVLWYCFPFFTVCASSVSSDLTLL